MSKELESGPSLSEATFHQSYNDNGKFSIQSDGVSLSLLSSPSSNTLLSSPYTPKPLVYADHTASSKPLSLVESYISQTVLPTYANTHTTTGHCGSQTTAFVAEARGVIGDCINARTTGKASKVSPRRSSLVR